MSALITCGSCSYFQDHYQIWFPKNNFRLIKLHLKWAIPICNCSSQVNLFPTKAISDLVMQSFLHVFFFALSCHSFHTAPTATDRRLFQNCSENIFALPAQDCQRVRQRNLGQSRSGNTFGGGAKAILALLAGVKIIKNFLGFFSRPHQVTHHHQSEISRSLSFLLKSELPNYISIHNSWRAMTVSITDFKILS